MIVAAVLIVFFICAAMTAQPIIESRHVRKMLKMQQDHELEKGQMIREIKLLGEDK